MLVNLMENESVMLLDPVFVLMLDQEERVVFLNEEFSYIIQERDNVLKQPLSYLLSQLQVNIIQAQPQHLRILYRGMEYRIHWFRDENISIGFLINKEDERMSDALIQHQPIFHISKYAKGLPLLYGSKRFFASFGYREEEFLSLYHHSTLECLLPKSQQAIMNSVDEILSQGYGYVFLPIVGKMNNGKLFHYVTCMFFMRQKEEIIFLCMSLTHPLQQVLIKEYESEKQKLQLMMSKLHCSMWEYHFDTRMLIPDRNSTPYFGDFHSVVNGPQHLIEQHIILPQDEAAFLQMFEDLKTKKEVSADIHFQLPDGRVILLRMTHIRLDADCALGFAEDMTAMEEAKNRYLKEGRLRNALVQDALVSYEINIDQDRIIDDIIERNVDILKMVGLQVDCSYSEFLKRWASSKVDVRDQERFLHKLSVEELKYNAYLGTTEVTCEYRSYTSKQQIIWIETNVHLTKNTEGELCGFVYVKNIHERKKEEERLRILSELDPLTRLYNRNIMMNKIEAHIKKYPDQLCALFVVDIDDFKEVNDTFGHIYGDKVLKDFAYKLTTIFPMKDILGRYGGDEFVIFATKLQTEEEALKKANVIFKEAKMHCELANSKKELSNSIGISFYPKHGKTFTELFDKADRALYEAKKSGKQQFRVCENELKVMAPSTFINKEWLMDEMDEIVYVSDIDTYELLYLNKTGRMFSNLQVGDYEHRKCYEVIQGRKDPCPFCSNHLLSHDHFYTWEHENKLLNRTFFLKDKLIYWDHKSVRMEIAIDMSKPGNLYSLNTKYHMEQTISTCIQLLNESEEFDNAIQKVLQQIGIFFQADRVNMMDVNEQRKVIFCRFEWCADSIRERIHTVQGMPVDRIPSIYEACKRKEHLIIPNIEELAQQSLPDYESLSARDVVSFFIVPYEKENVARGYIEVDNPKSNLDCISMVDSILFSIANVMKRKQMLDTLTYYIYHDGMTGLLNRNRYSAFLEESKTMEYHAMGIIFGDINGLKKMNRDFGHTYGNKVINQVPSIMMNCYPDADCYRLSGDEFCIISKDQDYDAFMQQLQLMEPQFDLVALYGVSIGHTYTKNHHDIEELIRHAEEAMIINKRLYYDESKTFGKRYSKERLDALLHALDQHQFHMFLQPKYDAHEETIIACEALARMIHPEFGMIPPNRFIPILEKEGMIHYLDFFILKEACDVLLYWKQQGWQLVPISVNFSRITLLEKDLMTKLLELKQTYAQVISYIVIEITESVGNMERHVISSIGKKIKNLGFTLSLDDFGADYANMSILSSMEFDELKLDRSMIENLVHNEANQIVVKGVLDMCRKLHVKIVAEGVETKSQLEILKSMGCDIIQGFYFSPPISISEFEKMMKR